MKEGIIVSFDGIDGCGKGTIAEMVQKEMNQGFSRHTILFDEPKEHIIPVKKLLSAVHKYISDQEQQARIDLALFVADRIEQQLDDQWHKNKGVIILKDRSWLSTCAYQGVQGIPLKEIMELHTHMVKPDIAFILDCPAHIALQRVKKDNRRSSDLEEFEKKAEFLESVRQRFLELPGALPNHKIIIINAQVPAEQVFEKVKKYLDEFLKDRGR